jgi:hypothetical protein
MEAMQRQGQISVKDGSESWMALRWIANQARSLDFSVRFGEEGGEEGQDQNAPHLNESKKCVRRRGIVGKARTLLVSLLSLSVAASSIGNPNTFSSLRTTRLFVSTLGGWSGESGGVGFGDERGVKAMNTVSMSVVNGPSRARVGV